MRLLIVQGGFGAGGAEKNVALLATHRHALGDEVHVMGFAAAPGGSYFPYPDQVRLVFAHQDQPPIPTLRPLSRALRIRQEIQALKPDLVLSFLTKINVLTLMASIGTRSMGAGTPVIISERNNPMAQTAHPAWRHLQSLLAQRAQSVVVQTDRACEIWPRRVRHKLQVIPNPCTPAERPLRMPSYHHAHLVAVGRLDPQKGFDTLIAAMPAIVNAYPGARLTIYGDGPERQRLETQREALGLTDHVALPGRSTKPGGWLVDADLLIAPSRFEGFPNVIAEAVVSGLPVVAADCDFGPREMIREGENGVLVPVDDTDALANATLALLCNRPLMVQMQRQTAAARAMLDPDTVLARWDRVLGHAAGHHANPSVSLPPVKAPEPPPDPQMTQSDDPPHGRDPAGPDHARHRGG